MGTGTAHLSDFLKPACVALDLKALSKREALAELCELLVQGNGLAQAQAVLEAVAKREEATGTGIGSGVAVPHARTLAVDKTMLAVGLSRYGVPFDAPDRQPVRIFFLLVGPPDSSALHLQLLSQIAHGMKDAAVRSKLLEAVRPEDVFALLKTA